MKFLSASLMMILIYLQPTLSFNIKPLLMAVEVPTPTHILPVEIVPDNFQALLQMLKDSRVQRATVAGWNGTPGNFVLYDNGAVVPAKECDAPLYSIYYDADGCPPYRVLLVVRCSPENVRCYEPCTPVRIVVPRCYPPNPCPNPCPSPCPEVAPICESPFPPPCDKSQPDNADCCLFPTELVCRKEKCEEIPSGKIETITRTSRRFVFARCSNGKAYLRAITKVSSERTITADPSCNEIRLCPSILRDYELLKQIRDAVETKFNLPVELFLTSDNCIIAKQLDGTKQCNYYMICYDREDKECPVQETKPLSFKKFTRLLCSGLTQVCFVGF